MTRPDQIAFLRAFPNGPGGGNPTAIGLGCAALGGDDMRALAAAFGHESGFVLPPADPSSADLRLRFFVPRHEMEMCGHATIGALWALRARGVIAAGRLRIETASGPVEARVPAEGAIAISQPAGTVAPLAAEDTKATLAVLGLAPGDLAEAPLVNASTSRAKTLVPLRDVARLDALAPDLAAMEGLCTRIGSTGLYPFAPGAAPGLWHARQFPRASGYPEDAATGIAAAALAYGLLRSGRTAADTPLRIRQGEAMGSPSEIGVAFRDGDPARGRWISGSCLPV